MTQEDEKYFENLIDMFSSEGWKAFVAEIQKGQTTTANELAFKSDATSSDLHYMRGRVQAYTQILNFETGIRNTFDQLKAEERKEAEDADI